MEAEMKTYHGYKRDLKFMLISSGLWPNYEKYPKALKMLLTFISGFVSCAISGGVFAFCVVHGNDLSLLAKGMAAFVAYFSVVLKVFTIAHHQKRLQRLNEGVSTIFERDLQNPEYRPYLLRHVNTFSKMFYTFDYFIGMNLLLILTIPLSMIRHGKYIGVYPTVKPFSYEPGGLVHWLVFAFEIHFTFYLWSVTCGVDSFLGLYALHIVGELRLLSSKFKKLLSNENYKAELKDIVDRHSLLMESQHLLEEVFGFLVIWLAVTCAVILCFVIFQATQASSLTLMKLLFIFTWTSLKLIQAFSYSWYGNIIAVESQNCLDAIYMAKWAGIGDVRFMNDILIILSQNPLPFKAKNLMSLDYNVFSKIVNTSVSYFFLLQTLEEKALEQ